jgi:hypothetical protein
MYGDQAQKGPTFRADLSVLADALFCLEFV